MVNNDEDFSSEESEKSQVSKKSGSADSLTYNYESDRNYELELADFNKTFLKYVSARKAYMLAWRELKLVTQLLPGTSIFTIDGVAVDSE